MGLSGFLPFPYTFYPEANSSLKKETIPHLPMDDHWRAGDFGLGSVLSAYESDRGRGVDVRDWVLRLFERYQFVLGTLSKTRYLHMLLTIELGGRHNKHILCDAKQSIGRLQNGQGYANIRGDNDALYER
jgi:gamma-glutamyl:cysteine ligase YbdK (ATP-grasp superfamily)